MKPIIFVRIADMKRYRGVQPDDIPVNGGKYVDENQDANEAYNFERFVSSDGRNLCVGFAMMQKSTQLRIENIIECELCKNSDYVEDVTVVFCSTRRDSKYMRVAGFYRHAKVYRNYQYMEFKNGYLQDFLFEAESRDCVLIPYNERVKHKEWFVPLANDKDYGFGFGRSNIWFANNYKENPKLESFVERMIASTDNYNGANVIWEV